MRFPMRRLAACLVALVSFAALAAPVGCSSSAGLVAVDSGSGDAHAAPGDSATSTAAPADPQPADSTVDSTVADTAAPDTATPDTAAGDTAAPDTAAPDTSVPDTSVADTSVADTGMASDATPAPFTVGGTITGSEGETIVLQDDGGDNLTLMTDGAFTFATPLATGTPFTVTVSSQPANLTCTVANGTGTVGSANVSSVMV